MANVSSLGTYFFNSVIDVNNGTTLNRIAIRYNSASVVSGLIIDNNIGQAELNPIITVNVTRNHPFPAGVIVDPYRVANPPLDEVLPGTPLVRSKKAYAKLVAPPFLITSMYH